MYDQIHARDIPSRTLLHYWLKKLTKCARKVLDSQGVPKKRFWFSALKNGVKISFKRLDPAKQGIFFDTSSRECYLAPVDPAIISDTYLIHRGIVKNKNFNNIHSLCENRIFGDIRQNMPTYIAPLSKSAIPTKNLFTPRQNVTLLINKKTLAGLRKIYSDPEMMFLVIPGDVLGVAYFVLGGIPEIAIDGVSFATSKGKATFTLRNGLQVELALN